MLTVISANSGAFCASCSRVVASTTITSDEAACAFSPPRGSFCRSIFASGIVTWPETFMRSAVRTSLRSGVTITRAPGMSAARTRSPPTCMSTLPERSALPANARRPSPETMPPSMAISPEGAGRTCSCPCLSFNPTAGMSAASSVALTRPDSSGACAVPPTPTSASTRPCTFASCGTNTASGARSGICPRTRPVIGVDAWPRSCALPSACSVPFGSNPRVERSSRVRPGQRRSEPQAVIAQQLLRRFLRLVSRSRGEVARDAAGFRLDQHVAEQLALRRPPHFAVTLQRAFERDWVSDVAKALPSASGTFASE